MCYLPLLFIFIDQFELLREYYFLLLVTTLIGFIIYYFFPTTAPASVMKGAYFSSEQLATGLKFHEIHSGIPPSTNLGGLIAFPSYHCIWALCCLYLLKDHPIPFFILLVLNSIILISCFMIGWHYLADVIGGVLVTYIAYTLLQYVKKSNKATKDN
jgi:membrane-associated phospholipid phosphatase